MKQILFTLLFSLTILVFGQEIPKPDWDELQKTKPWEQTELNKEIPIVTPGELNKPPSDAVILYNGSALSNWQKPQFDFPVSMEGFKVMIPQMKSTYKNPPVSWKSDKGVMTVEPGAGAIATKKAFGDIQLHIEWFAPIVEGKSGQGYSNSGIFLMGLYEVQILNSYENPTYANGQAASVYKQHIPLVNASLAPGFWQEYDIIFMAPRFSEKGTLVRPAKVTVLHNGVLVQNGVELLGPTCYIGTPYYVAHPEKLPLILQDHGDPMQFRNIWVREL
ncbi:MAG: DUF1080 domain-containing protein [Cyclobacteriaceae bacterium]